MSEKRDFCQRLGYGVIAAATCQTRLHLTLLIYALIALLLLAYVSANVMTSVLTQEISELKQQRHENKETLNKLTSEYVSKSSRARVIHYCESVLGMVPAEETSFQRYAVHRNTTVSGGVTQLMGDFPGSADLTRYTSFGKNGAPKQ